MCSIYICNVLARVENVTNAFGEGVFTVFNIDYNNKKKCFFSTKPLE